jgi:hypothetical protein
VYADSFACCLYSIVCFYLHFVAAAAAAAEAAHHVDVRPEEVSADACCCVDVARNEPCDEAGGGARRRVDKVGDEVTAPLQGEVQQQQQQMVQALRPEFDSWWVLYCR